MTPKISILHPSWKRPDLALQCYKKWMSEAWAPEELEYILCLSVLDPAMDEYQRHFAGTNVSIVLTETNGLIIQVNYAATQAKGNLLVAVSDDFECPTHWDKTLLLAGMGQEDYCIKTQDGLQPFIQTLPIMDRKFYERLGHIYHPDYHHMYGDEELAMVGKMLNRIITLPDYFRHNHYSTGVNPKDEVNERNDSFFMVDRETFLRRKKANFGVVLLSILIPTMPSRKDMAVSLHEILTTQIGDLAVEVIFSADHADSLGKKRNDLLSRAKGEYVCFFDDDDLPADHYIFCIKSALQINPDCCSLRGVITTDGKDPKQFIHSIKYKEYYEKDGIYYRPPNHLNVIKRSIAQQFKFPEINFGEDTDWAMQICRSGLLKKEAEINETLYYYKYVSNK